MKSKIFLNLLSPFLIIAFVACSFAEEPANNMTSSSPDIEGTYKLVSRKMSDGTMVKPPAIIGLLTFTENYRNFNVFWKDDKGKVFSYSLVSEYKLTENEYTETLLFSIMNDEIRGNGLNYDLSGETRTAVVKSENGHLKFNPPFDPPVLTFMENKIVASSEGMFEDTWEKVQ
ncbi:hypothetical protein GF337_13880 [candidate division KSB1 bacterium]|nr:hypothetical protein [candidate division KSB1 bacterium]